MVAQVPQPNRVFVVQEGTHDYSSAYKHGDIDILANGEISSVPLNISPQNLAIVERISAKLHEYIPGRDFILLTGSPIAIAWVVLLLSHKFGRQATHKFLKWDNFRRDYVPYVVSLLDLERMQERAAHV